MDKKEAGRSRKKKEFPVMAAAMAGAVSLTAAGLGAGYYIYRGKQYETAFFPSTVINGIDASDKTVEQMKGLISAVMEDYELVIKKRGGETERITGEDIGLTSIFDGKLEEYLAQQEPLKWLMQKGREKDYEIEAALEYDEEKLEQKIESLEMLDRGKMVPPVDAYLSDYLPGQGYVVVPEEPGTVLDREKAAEAIREAVKNFEEELDLEKLDVYAKADVTSDDAALNQMADRLNRHVNMTVTYAFGEEQEELGGELISKWATLGEGDEVTISQEAVAAYVEELADKYDTAARPKALKTSSGQTVEIAKGTYGWKIDQKAEAEQLYQILLSGESQTREPVYSQEGASRGENDYGDTYVEINLTAQHLYFYKSGQLLVESDLVSGNVARGNSTPSGVFPLAYKQRNAVLRGANYASPVSYWMPFNGGIGMHDATWRGTFGGSIYRTNGSHGCINLPKAVAKTIFENIEKGTPVLCYYLDGTESSKTSQGGGGNAAAAAPAPAPAAPPVESPPAAETAPAANETDAQNPAAQGQPESSADDGKETQRGTLPWENGPGVTAAESQETPDPADGGGGQPETSPAGPAGPAGPGDPAADSGSQDLRVLVVQ